MSFRHVLKILDSVGWDGGIGLLGFIHHPFSLHEKAHPKNRAKKINAGCKLGNCIPSPQTSFSIVT